MKKIILICSIFFFIEYPTFADHIVGVDLSMYPVNKTNANFKFVMNMFVDHYVQPDANQQKENLIHIYSKKDGRYIQSVILYGYIFSEVHLTYTNPKCAEKNNLHVYYQHLEREVKLDITKYSDDEGYFVYYERCCRSKQLVNILDNEETPIGILMEFPSLKKYPQYTSPEFGTPNGEFICVNEPFQMSFDASNTAGKNVKYKIVESLAGRTSKSRPVPADPLLIWQNLPPVKWTTGNTGTNPIPASKPLSIDEKTGLLTITPTKKGVYCFAVMIEVYDGNTRIGYTTRDYNLAVVDCPINKPPKPTISYLGSPTTQIELCPGTNANLETESDPNWNYRWQNNLDNIADAITNKIAVKDTGTYRVIKSLKSDCSDESISEVVKVKLSSGASLIKIKTNQTNGCDGDKIKLELQDPNQTADWYLANTFIKKDKFVEADKSGDYIAKTSGGSSTCPTSQDNILIKILPKPTVSSPNHTYEICPSESVSLETVSNIDYIYQWYKGTTAITGATTAKHQATEIGSYTVKVNYTNITCEVTSQIFKVSLKTLCGGVVVLPPDSENSRIIVPTAFTPNDDRLNDTWQIKDINRYPDCEISVYNTWGELIFQSKGYENAWDGRYKELNVPAGTYIYKIDLKKENQSILRGYVNVIY